MLEHRQATDGRWWVVRHSGSQWVGYAVLLFTCAQLLVKVPRLDAPTGKSKLFLSSRGHKRTDSQRHSPYSTAARLRAHAGLSHFRTVFVPNATWVEIRASNP